jgi:hypothetical protein
VLSRAAAPSGQPAGAIPVWSTNSKSLILSD